MNKIIIFKNRFYGRIRHLTKFSEQNFLYKKEEIVLLESLFTICVPRVLLVFSRFEENGGQTEQRRIDDLNEVSNFFSN